MWGAHARLVIGPEASFRVDFDSAYEQLQLYAVEGGGWLCYWPWTSFFSVMRAVGAMPSIIYVVGEKRGHAEVRRKQEMRRFCVMRVAGGTS